MNDILFNITIVHEVRERKETPEKIIKLSMMIQIQIPFSE